MAEGYKMTDVEAKRRQDYLDSKGVKPVDIWAKIKGLFHRDTTPKGNVPDPRTLEEMWAEYQKTGGADDPDAFRDWIKSSIVWGGYDVSDEGGAFPVWWDVSHSK